MWPFVILNKIPAHVTKNAPTRNISGTVFTFSKIFVKFYWNLD